MIAQLHLQLFSLFLLILATSGCSTAREQELPTEPNSIEANIENDEKLYQVVNGKIDDSTFEGWRTYNGGGCGQCHGGGGTELVASLVSKIDKELFKDYVTNGVPGTQMKPHKNNKRLMKNLDNLYAYLKARADGVLGPNNLIKFPLGNKE